MESPPVAAEQTNFAQTCTNFPPPFKHEHPTTNQRHRLVASPNHRIGTTTRHRTRRRAHIIPTTTVRGVSDLRARGVVRRRTSRMALWCRSRSTLRMKRGDQYFPLLTDDVFAIYPSSFFHFRLQEVIFGPHRLLTTSPMISTTKSRRPTGCYTNCHQSHRRSDAISTLSTPRHYFPSKASKHGSLQEFLLRH
jgi:hypothetical protein